MTTKEFLNEHVEFVFDDFFATQQWCSLNGTELSVNYYTDITYQQKYIIKYFSAYFCEYYEMYEKFFKDFDGDSVNILSIGCGSGIDCYALNRVLIDNNLDITVSYVGLDYVDWSYRPTFNWATFKQGCISSLAASDLNNVNLLVFPKSLTELSYEQRCDFAALLANNNKEKHLYFINTYVTNYPVEYTHVDGIEQFVTISRILEKDSLKPQTNPYQYFYKTKYNEWLGRSYRFFSIPDKVVPIVSKLQSLCVNKGNQSECATCEINFYPVLKANYLAFNLVKFEREV
uniref:Methyltransferase domain-containing protein n=1 Tax=Aliivibrio wodanis TaxID=80852 RepID=A0A5Q4ZNW6_9GAMM|nr:hypothetical protein AW0309160_01357 [Aliivibrio wodanis]